MKYMLLALTIFSAREAEAGSGGDRPARNNQPDSSA
jgi:hypothetical protein